MSYIGKPLTLVNMMSSELSRKMSPAGPAVFEFEDNLILANETLAQRIVAEFDFPNMHAEQH